MTISSKTPSTPRTRRSCFLRMVHGVKRTYGIPPWDQKDLQMSYLFIRHMRWATLRHLQMEFEPPHEAAMGALVSLNLNNQPIKHHRHNQVSLTPMDNRASVVGLHKLRKAGRRSSNSNLSKDPISRKPRVSPTRPREVTLPRMICRQISRSQGREEVLNMLRCIPTNKGREWHPPLEAPVRSRLRRTNRR